ncbi:MAG: hypothetical protein H7246_16190 [Phycisphaerae bacterium]|nr:hypothetical protein [Saprospiraceae bacterium]
MQLQSSFSKMAGAAAMLSCPIGLASIILVFNAFNWDFEAAFNPLKAIAYLPDPSSALRWGWFLDIIGYYLLLAPAVIYLHYWLSPRASLHSNLFAFFGLGYVLTGALGAAVLTGATQPLFTAYNTSDPAQQLAVAQIYATLVHAVMDGIWNMFSMLMGAIWWLGTGWLLRSERKWLALFFTFMGIASLLDVVGMALQNEFASTLGLNIYLWFAPIVAFWLGAIVWKRQDISTQQN